jgi:hypothetical protein
MNAAKVSTNEPLTASANSIELPIQQWVNATMSSASKRQIGRRSKEAQRIVKEAERQIDFLLNQGTSREEFGFLSLRYLASKGSSLDIIFPD